MESLQSHIFEVNGSKYKIRAVAVYDMSEQDTVLGKQNSGSNLPCSKCLITRDHMREQTGVPHSKETCCKFPAKTMEYYITRGRKADEGNLETARKKGKDNCNVIGRPLYNFQSIEDFIDPLLHIEMGLGNDLLRYLREFCQKLDKVSKSDEHQREATE